MRSTTLFARIFTCPSITTIARRLLGLFSPRERFRIIAMDRIAPRVVRIRLVPESGTIHSYRAGQFIFIRFDIPGLSRKAHAFSIVNPPGQPFIEIMVKGRGNWSLGLYDRAAAFCGSQAPWMAWIAYPYGTFTTKGVSEGPWVFLAAGIGITPFLAMAGDSIPDKVRLLILWAAHNRDELAGFDRLSAINARRPSIRMVPLLGHDPLWTGHRGPLDRQTLQDLAGQELANPQTRYWICCPAPLRRTLVKALRGLGVPRKSIRYEVFSR